MLKNVKPGSINWIRARELWVNPNHQGGEHPGTLKYLRSEWKGSVNGDDRCNGLPQPLTATPEGELLDGLHTHKVATEKHGADVLLETYVTPQLSPAEKSARYLDINRVHKRRPIDRYRNAVIAGSEDETYSAAAFVDSALEAIGLSVSDNASGSTLACPAILMRIEGLGGAALCASAASLCRATWTDDPDRFDGRLIEGAARFLLTEEELDRKAFARKVSKTRAASVIAKARALKDADFRSDLGRTVPALAGHVMRDLYRRGRRS